MKSLCKLIWIAPFILILGNSSYTEAMDWDSIIIEKDSAEDRAIGSLVGLAVGDAMGVTHETFVEDATTLDQIHLNVINQRKKIQANRDQLQMIGGGPWQPDLTLDPGEFTDDTSMALCLADSIITHQDLNLMDLMSRFNLWWDTGYNASRYEFTGRKWIGQPWGLGTNTGLALERFKRNPNDPIQGGTDSMKDAGNGAIMRLAPVAIYWRDDIKKAMLMAGTQATCTHHVQEAIDASSYLASIIVKAIQGHSKNESLFLENTETLNHKEIIEISQPSAQWLNKTEDEIRTLPGRCLWSLEAALWIVQNTSNFQDAISLAISLGGDADTVAAITGQIAGALYGLSGIPEDWLETLSHYEKIRRKGIALVRKLPFSQELSLP